MTNLVFEVNSAALTDPGRKRPHNEDFVAFFEPDDAEELNSSGNLYIVADGVGGATKGERASQYAAQKVLYEYYRPPQIEPDERLRQSMRSACKEIHAYSQQNDSPSRMATTMVAAVVRGQTLTVANVGDSRAYLIRNGRIDQITQDHTFVGEMVRSGVMTEEEAQRSKRKNRLSRSLGGESDVKVDTFPNLALKTGDRILLCSDGLTRYTTHEDLIRLAGTGLPMEVVERLIKFANSQGGVDNVSAILVVVGQLVNVADAIKIKFRGQEPTPVDWETMATEVAPIYRRSLPQLVLQKKYLPLVMIGVVIVCVLGVIGLAFSLGGTRTGNQLDGIQIDSPTSSDQITGIFTPTMQMDSQGVTPDSTLSDASYPSPNPTEFPPEEATQSSTIPEAANGQFICVVFIDETKTGIGMEDLLSGFDKKYVPGDEYYQCRQEEDFFCDVKLPIDEINNYPIVPINAWVLIPDAGEQNCLNGSGQWEAVSTEN